MKPSYQDQVYSRLYRCWQRENIQKNLTEIPEKECFMEDLRELINELNKNIEKTKNTTIKNIHHKTIENIQFMTKDLLNIREEKILEITRKIQRIDEKYLLSMEKAYYRQLYTAFKGYSKSKKLLMEGILTNGNLKGISSTYDSSSVKKDSHSTKSQPSKEKPPSPTQQPINTSSSSFEKKPQEKSNQSYSNNQSKQRVTPPTIKSPKKENSNQTPSLTANPHQSTSASNKSVDNTPAKDTKTKKMKKKKKIKSSPSAQHPRNSIKFIALRIIKEIDSIVGEDMKIYGPFHPGNFVFLPKSNGKVLIDENCAIPLKG
jgi:DNA replication initiation complex subunit (GINS family)